LKQRFLLDTNIISDLMRHPDGGVAAKIAEVGERRVSTSIIVAAELRYGAAKKKSQRISHQLDMILAAMDVLPLEPPVDHRYGRLRAELESSGKLIGPNDLLIAAQALTLDCVLVTDNEREFERVPGLRWENWLV
jgi:tRNA(fMet)-specific endonuclease VapC